MTDKFSSNPKRYRSLGGLGGLLLLSGFVGFAWGAFYEPCWQNAVEGAQVLAGLVKYPDANPFYLYQMKTWTLLHQLPAVGLKLGLSEKLLSVVLSGVMGMLSLQALALSVYVFYRGVWGSVFSAVLILLSGAVNFGLVYPIQLLGSSATYGQIGLAFLFIALALMSLGRIRWAALLLGLCPAIHFGFGVLGFGVVFMVAVLEWKNRECRRRDFVRFYVIGAGLSLISFAFQWPWLRQLPAVDADLMRTYFLGFVRIWDAHRQPIVLSSPGIILGAISLVGVWAALRFFRDSIPSGTILMMRVYQSVSILSFLFVAILRAPLEALPSWFLVLMPARLLNVVVLGFPGMLIGLWARQKKNSAFWGLLSLQIILLSVSLRGWIFYLLIASALLLCGYLLVRCSGFLTGPGPVRQKGLDGFRILFFALLIPAVYWMAAGYQRRPLENWAYYRNDPLYKKVSEGKGTLLLGSNMGMVQLLIRRPVLMDGNLDMICYAAEGAPELARIFKEIYRIDYFSPPESVYGTAGFPPDVDRRLVDGRTIEDWRKIRREFGVTQLLIEKPSLISLPLVASNGDLDLYELPT